MAEQEQFSSISEVLQQLEDSLSKGMTKSTEIFERCKKSTQYQSDQEFRAICDGIQGLLADMSNDLELVKQAKANLK